MPDPKKEFKVRDCAEYLAEHQACVSLSNRIQTYYTFGYYQKKEDCQHWKEMLELCNRCTKENDAEAKTTLLMKERGMADKVISNRASVWTYRDQPPMMWYFPGKSENDLKSSK